MAKKNPTTTQTTLFGTTPTEDGLKHAVILKEPDPQRYFKQRDELLYNYTKDQLYDKGRTFSPMMKDKLVMLEKADGSLVPTRSIAPLFTMASRKEEMAVALAYLLSEPANLMPYVSMLNDGMRRLWQHLLIHFYVSHETAQQLLGTTDTLYTESYYYYDSSAWNKPGFDFFSLKRSLKAKAESWGWRKNGYFIYTKPDIHGLFFPLFFASVYDADPTVAELPSDDYLTFSLEEESIAKYQLLSSLIKAGKVAMLQKGISQADVKKAAKQLGMLEFMPGGEPPLSAIRSHFYIELLALEHYRHESKKALPYHKVMRRIIEKLSDFQPYLPALLLPHIKGLRKAMTDANDLDELCQSLLTWLQDEPDRWSSIDGVILKLYALKAGSATLQQTMMVFDITEQSEKSEIVNEFSGKRIACDSFVEEFGFTALRAFAFMLASLGIAELALSPNDNPATPFARAEYLRLTPLGRYALGIDHEYEPPQQEQVAYFELDPDRLIIRSLIEPNPYAQLLLDTSTAISRNRFETSPQSFLSHCSSREDVEEKIGVFRQFVSNELPPLWQQFFDSLLLHCNPLASDTTAYNVYRLSPGNTDLLRLLTSDARLRRLFIRAEGYLILVKKEDQKRFTDELKKHGYLL